MIDDPPIGGEPPDVPADAPSEAESPFASLELAANVTGPAALAAPPARSIERAGSTSCSTCRSACRSSSGRTEVPIRDVVNLGRGSIIELDRGPGTPLDVRVNGVLVGRGEVVLVNAERLGLRFVEVVSQAERMKRLS